MLKFAVTWEDETPGGQLHKFNLCFYLADNCCELCTNPQPGYDRFPHLLKRHPLPLNWNDVSQLGAAPRFAQVSDLVVGAELDVFNRKLRICDCSEFTRQWYVRHLRFRQPPAVPVDESALVPKSGGLGVGESSNRPKHQSPISQFDDGHDDMAFIGENDNNFGASEQVGTRTGKARDWEREFRIANKTIRCRLELCERDGTLKRPAAQANKSSLVPDEPPRTFILTYWLADNSLSIYEEHVSNSGVLGGTFLKRGRYKTKPLSGGPPRYFVASDFYTGAVVAVSQHNLMKVTEVDGASLKVMSEFSDEFPFSDANKILKKLLKELRRVAPLDVHAALGATHAYDSVCAGAMLEADFTAKLEALGILAALNAQEKLTLAMTFRAHTGGDRPYITDVHRFCDTLAFQHNAQPASSATAQNNDSSLAGLTDDDSVAATSLANTTIADSVAVGPDLLGALCTLPVLLRKSFEAASTATSGKTLSIATVNRVLDAAANVKIGQDHLNWILANFGAMDRVDIHALCDAIYACNFSLSD